MAGIAWFQALLAIVRRGLKHRHHGEAEGPWVVVEWEGSQAEACRAQAEVEGGKVGLKAPLLNKELGICLC